jgi:hypothetical protein
MFALTSRTSALGVAVGLLLACASSRADEAKVELKVGEDAPTFQLRDQSDATWSSSDRFGKKWVVTHYSI